MKKLLFILLLLTPRAWASCPLWTYPDNHKLDSEINNICQNELNPTFNNATGSSMTVTYINTSSLTVVGQISTSSMTLAYINVSSLTVIGQVNGIAGRVKQYVQATQTANKSTTSTSYVTTDLTATITPLVTSAIRISFSGELGNPVGGSVFVTVQRGTTELAANSNGFCDTGSGTLALIVNCGVTLIDAPGTASATTYIVKFKTNTGTAQWNENGGTAHLLLEELTQ